MTHSYCRQCGQAFDTRDGYRTCGRCNRGINVRAEPQPAAEKERR